MAECRSDVGLIGGSYSQRAESYQDNSRESGGRPEAIRRVDQVTVEPRAELNATAAELF